MEGEQWLQSCHVVFTALIDDGGEISLENRYIIDKWYQRQKTSLQIIVEAFFNCVPNLNTFIKVSSLTVLQKNSPSSIECRA